MSSDTTSEPMRVLIAGCGYVGRELARRLTDAGHRVWGLSRHPGGLPGEAEPVAADLTDPSTLRGLPEGLDAVVYSAAADGFHPNAYHAAYIEGPRHLLAAVERNGSDPRRVVFTSSTGVYGQTSGKEVDEDSPADSDHFSGEFVREGEEVFLDGPFPAVVARLGGIYGPGRTRTLDQVRAGEATCDEKHPHYTNRIHRDDAAGAILHLLTLDSPAPIYNVVDKDPAERCEVLRWIAGQLGVEPPRHVDRDEGGRRSRSNKRVSSRRLQESGYEYEYPTFREGYGALIEAAEKKG